MTLKSKRTGRGLEMVRGLRNLKEVQARKGNNLLQRGSTTRKQFAQGLRSVQKTGSYIKSKSIRKNKKSQRTHILLNYAR